MQKQLKSTNVRSSGSKNRLEYYRTSPYDVFFEFRKEFYLLYAWCQLPRVEIKICKVDAGIPGSPIAVMNQELYSTSMFCRSLDLVEECIDLIMYRICNGYTSLSDPVDLTLIYGGLVDGRPLLVNPTRSSQ